MDLIPDGYVDIHGHYLPGIDDGAKNLDETKQLLTAVKELGFQKIVATPHSMDSIWVNTKESILGALEKVSVSEIPNDLNIELSAASEYMMDEGFLEKLDEGLLTIKDNYVLVEMSYMTPPVNLYEQLFQIQLKGYVPVLAHPERYNFYHNNFKEFQKLKDAGCLFQLNLLSLGSYYGKEVNKCANKLLQEGMYNFVGSDVHHVRHLDALKRIVVKKHIDEINRIIRNNITIFS